MAIRQEKIRAKISGAGFDVSTPYILSFYVRKNRGELYTFNFSAKVLTDSFSVNEAGGQLSIWVGVNSPSNKIFTGVVTNVRIRPCFDDPTYIIVDVNGTDIRKYLQGKKYTRRQKTSKACWLEITGVSRPGLRSQKLTHSKSAGFSNSLYLSPDGGLNRSDIDNNSPTENALEKNATTGGQTASTDHEPAIEVSVHQIVTEGDT